MAADFRPYYPGRRWRNMFKEIDQFAPRLRGSKNPTYQVPSVIGQEFRQYTGNSSAGASPPPPEPARRRMGSTPPKGSGAR